MKHRLNRRSCHGRYHPSKVAIYGIPEEDRHGPTHHISGNRVHSHYHQRERPSPPSFPFDQRVKSGQDQDYPTTTIERVRRCPDPLDDRANASPLTRQPEQKQARSRDYKPTQFLGLRLVALEPLSGQETENHGRECRNKTQGGPAPLIEDKGLRSRKEIQEPNIKRPCKIGILVPVREESAVIVRPIWRNADPGVVKLWARRWIQGKAAQKQIKISTSANIWVRGRVKASRNRNT